MEENLDQFIDQFYGKYSPDNIPQGDRRERLKEKLRTDFDGYVGQMYSKYAPDNVPDATRLGSLKGKYLLTEPPTVEQPTESGGVMDYVNAGVGAINRGVMQTVAQPLKLAGALQRTAASAVGYPENVDLPFDAGSVGRDIESFTEQVNPRFENVNQTFQSVGEGLGQAAGMIATAGLGAGSRATQIGEMAINAPTSLLGATGKALTSIGKTATSTTGVIGGSMTAVPEWEAAKQAGLSDEEAFQTLLKNYLVGQTEALPIERLMVGLNRITGGRILETVKLMGQQGLTEGTQEAIQTYLTNEIAKDDYDPDRDPLFQVLESAKVGGIVGMILPGAMSIAQGVSADKRVKLERKLGELQAEEAISELGDTGDPALNAEIDNAAQIDPVDKQVLEEVKVAEAVQEDQKEVEAEEKLQDDLQGDAENTTAEEAEIKPSETPEYKDAVAKVTRLQEQFAALPIEENADQLLFDLREARQALQKIAGKPKPGKKTAIQKQIEDATGVTKPEKISITPAQAIKNQVQTFFRGMDKGVRKGKELSNELVVKVQEAIKDSPLKPKQINTLLTRIRNTNLYTPGSVSRLNDFIDKVTNDADYADKLSEAKALNKKLRKLSKSSNSNLQNIKSLGKSFASINPEDTFINPHLEVGNKILSALTSPTSEKYSAVDAEEAQAYISDLQDKISQFEVEEMAKEPDGDKRNVQLFAALQMSMEALNEKDISNFDESEKRIVNTLKSLDPSTLKDEQAIAIVRVMDNIVQNEDFSNAEAVEPIIKAKQNLKEIDGKVEGAQKKEVGEIGKWGANVYQQFTRIFSDSGIAAEVQRLTGILDLFNAGSRVENQEIKLTKVLKEKIKDVNKRYKIKVQDLPNQVRLVIFSEFYKNYGDDSHIAKVKGNIIRTIKEYENSDPEIADTWKKEYEAFVNIETSAEALTEIEKTKGLYEIWKFFNDTFKTEINPRLSRLANELYNKPYLEANNYTHTDQKNISNTDAQKEALGQTSGSRKKVKPDQAKTAITATRSMKQGYAYNYDFIEGQLRGFRDSLYDIEASKPLALVRETIYTEDFNKVVGSKNAELIRRMVLRSEEIQRGMSRSTGNDAVKFLNKITQFLRNLGAIRALASLSQPVKQVPSVWGKAFFNHVGSGSLDAFFKGIGTVNLITTSPNLKKLLDQYTIGVRGERLGGIERGDSVGYRLSPGATRGWARLAEKMQGLSDQFGRTVLQPLTKSDVYAARTTWLGYYLQKLKEQGITKVDLNSEFEKQNDPQRQAAAAFAEQMLAETQVPSNPATLAQIVRNENDGGWNFAKNLLIPFSTFSLTAKYRNISDIGKFISNPNKRNASAVAGDVFEIAAFGGIAYALLPYYKDWLKTGIEELFGLESDDDDEKRVELKRKALLSNLVNATVPFAVGTPGEYITSKMANGLAWLAENDGATYNEWRKETGGFVYEPQSFEPGVFALGLEPFTESVSGVIDLAKGEASYDAFGQTREIQLSPEQQRLLALKTMFDMMGMVGIQEADIYNQVKKIYKEQLRQPQGGGTPSRTPRPISPPRPRRRRIPARKLN